ncbi:hypothetical protein ACIPSE_11740 [Streptomyces sp. NPDC090106]|uniref:hypothetical protein n=1 Tax=Streptomyces sp. NPDC090106 TaxID=3365946 RepID=UPI003823EC35
MTARRTPDPVVPSPDPVSTPANGARPAATAADAKAADTAERKTQAEEFIACVEKNGTATEKSAVEHVTKVTGADRRNDILDSAEVFTDYTGGFAGPDQGEAKLIASAFTSC